MERPFFLGQISSINYKKGCADVVFPDEEDVIKTELPFFSYEYRMPKVGDMVVVLFQNFKNRDQGFILGPVFNQKHFPEFPGKKNYFKRLSDKAYIRYDAETEILEIRAPRIRLKEDDS